jgi:hypothetical protein
MTLDTPSVAVDAATESVLARRYARLAAWSLLALTAVAIPASLLTTAAAAPIGLIAGGVSFGLAAVLDVVVAWGLYGLIRGTAPLLGAASLALRVAYALVLAGAAATLLFPGRDAAVFHWWWSGGLIIFGVHLVVTAFALRAISAPVVVWLLTGLAGLAYLIDALPAPLDLIPTIALVPFELGELVLMGWLFFVAYRKPGRRQQRLSAVAADPAE